MTTDTTRRLHSADGTSFQIDFDFVDHRLVVRTNRGESESFALVDELTVAAFDERLHATLRALGLDVSIRETPYGIRTTTPFPQDVDHAAYDPDAYDPDAYDPDAYEAVRTAPDPRKKLLAFLESAYRAGSGLAGWDRDELRSARCPHPDKLHEMLAG